MDKIIIPIGNNIDYTIDDIDKEIIWDEKSRNHGYNYYYLRYKNFNKSDNIPPKLLNLVNSYIVNVKDFNSKISIEELKPGQPLSKRKVDSKKKSNVILILIGGSVEFYFQLRDDITQKQMYYFEKATSIHFSNEIFNYEYGVYPRKTDIINNIKVNRETSYLITINY